MNRSIYLHTSHITIAAGDLVQVRDQRDGKLVVRQDRVVRLTREKLPTVNGEIKRWFVELETFPGLVPLSCCEPVGTKPLICSEGFDG